MVARIPQSTAGGAALPLTAVQVSVMVVHVCWLAGAVVLSINPFLKPDSAVVAVAAGVSATAAAGSTAEGPYHQHQLCGASCWCCSKPQSQHAQHILDCRSVRTHTPQPHWPPRIAVGVVATLCMHPGLRLLLILADSGLLIDSTI